MLFQPIYSGDVFKFIVDRYDTKLVFSKYMSDFRGFFAYHCHATEIYSFVNIFIRP